MSSLTVSEVQGQLVVDSRLIADELGIEHATLLKTIKKYLHRLERKTPVRFEIDVVKRPQGGTYEVSYCYLNESQSTLLMTYSRNTEQVLDCKDKLVDAFDKAKEIIKVVIPAQSDRIRELEMQLEISRNQRYILDKSDAIASIHGVGMLALFQGRPDAVVEVREKVTETIVVKDGRQVSFEGKSIAEAGRRFGFKTGVEFEKWLRKVGREDVICQGMRAISAPYIPTENLKELKDIWLKNKGKDRQLLIGE